MSSPDEFSVTKEQEIRQLAMLRPHVVIVGAGASVASFPRGDRNGRMLPVMDNLVEVLQLRNLFEKHGVKHEGIGFETLYAELYEDEKLRPLCTGLEERISEYFQQVEIVDDPTIYDHLVLSLRKKDVLASFNWDPLLLQAYLRVGHKGFHVPRLIFLHGNVGIGFCEKDRQLGVKGRLCTECRKSLAPSKLLYPVTKKDYQSDPMIKGQWDELLAAMKRAFMITIFGYSAPKTDVGAIDLLLNAWKGERERELEQVEIIDIKTEEELRRTWEPFIFSHHYETLTDFYESYLARHPRRSGEAYMNQFIEGKFTEDNPLPKSVGFEELEKWAQPLQHRETLAGYSMFSG
ncbi:MAG: hypothetical protein Q7J69_04780 [Candidatus Omnitrophota bacterium]|nr:hypothetical protein [Candidatus Omnitrophota bacterium]